MPPDQDDKLERIERIVFETRETIRANYLQRLDLKKEMDELKDTIDEWIPMMSELGRLVNGGTNKEPLSIRLNALEIQSNDTTAKVKWLWGWGFSVFTGAVLLLGGVVWSVLWNGGHP